MRCKECNRFCRFPQNPKCGLCAETVYELTYNKRSINDCLVDEDTVCKYRFAFPQRSDKNDDR